MRTNLLLLVLVAALVAGCTKPNPNRCCVDEADCAAAGLPSGMTCDDGYVCRGTVCVVESCSTATDCNLLAPYCIGAPAGACQDQCTDDTQCPGNGQDAAQHLCEAGACVEC